MVHTIPEETTSAPGDNTDMPLEWLEGLAVLVAHWKLLVAGPVIAAAVIYAGSFLLPKSYKSYAYVGPLDEDTAARSTALIRSPVVLEPALRALPDNALAAIAIEQRGAYIAQHLQIKPTNASNPKPRQLYVIEVVDPDRSLAQALLTSVVKAWVVAMRPPPDKTASLERLKEAYEFQAATLRPTVSQLAKDPELSRTDAKGESASRSLSELVKLRTEGVVKSEELRVALAGPGNDSIVQSPTVPPTAVVPPRHLYAAVAAGAVFVLLSVYLLIRDLLLPALANSAYGAKMRRIRGGSR